MLFFRPCDGAALDYTKADVFAVGLLMHAVLAPATPPYPSPDPREFHVADYAPIDCTQYPKALCDVSARMVHPDSNVRPFAVDALAWLDSDGAGVGVGVCPEQ